MFGKIKKLFFDSPLRYRWIAVDGKLIFSVFMLMLIGVIFVFDTCYTEKGASISGGWKQIGAIAAGIICYAFIVNIDLRMHKKWTFVGCIIMCLLFVCLMLFGTEVNGAKRWIDLKIFSIQPSELAKYILVLGMALLLELTDYFAYRDWWKHKRNTVYIIGIAIMLVFCFVCAAKESMSMGIVYTVIIASMLFFGNVGRTPFGKGLIVVGVVALLLAYPIVNIKAAQEKHDYGVADQKITAENEIKYAEDTESLLGSDRDRITEFECNNFFGKHKNDDLTDEEKRIVVSLMNYYEANYSYLTALDKLKEESRISNYEKLIDDAKNGKNFGKYIKAGSGENKWQIDYEKCFSDYGTADYKEDIAKAENCSRLNDYEKFILKNYFQTTVDYQKAILVKKLEEARENAEYASMSKFGAFWAKSGKAFKKRLGKKEEQRYVDYLYSRYSDFEFTRPYGEGSGSVLDKKIFMPEKIYTSFESGKNFRNRRLLAWKDPFRYRESEGQQPAYASLAVARGGFFGKFLGRGICKNYMAESDNDYIFSTIAEETGFVGCTVVLFFFCMFFWSCLCIVHSCKSNYGKMVAAGSFVALCTSVVIHIMVNLNLIPSTGVCLPYISAGGSNILANCMFLGIVAAVCKQSDIEDEIISPKVIYKGQEIPEKLVINLDQSVDE